MAGDWQSSYFLSRNGRSKPLNSKSASLNESLHTQHLDLRQEDDSLIANATRTISKVVGTFCTPRQVLGLLRVLKAITLVFIVLTILADLMYIVFVELLTSDEVKQMAGGNRDTILRLYGIVLALVGLAIELDYSRLVKKCSGLKGFIPRAFLYFFIALITGSHPIMLTFASADGENYYNDDGGGDDDGAADDAVEYDDAYVAAEEAAVTAVQFPASAVGFQRVTSFVLACCALGYFVCGLLCFDRFTARAFLSTKDPRVTTAIQAQTESVVPPIGHSESSGHEESTLGQEESTLGSSQI